MSSALLNPSTYSELDFYLWHYDFQQNTDKSHNNNQNRAHHIMKKALQTIILTLLCYSLPASAFEEFSAGVATISPTGLSFKVWQTRITAFDLFAEWDFDGEKYNFHADYMTHDYERLNAKETLMMFYHGYGIRIINEGGADEKTALGLRMPFGVSYLMDDPPLDVFGELAPRINVLPSTNFGLDVMIGVRYRIGFNH